jgi:hypothetical protein
MVESRVPPRGVASSTVPTTIWFLPQSDGRVDAEDVGSVV